ncbi:MAG: DUF2911 domain-containing protein [Flavobacteriales bacterium]|nr:DUF2911 domain-containing protein [Flavobacteriales bacterium]
MNDAKIIVSSLLIILGLSFQFAFAQKLPKASPASTLMSEVGLTVITINYSRPGVWERTIWGELVPYDKVWRTGADSCTTIEFSTDVKINETTITAGKYSFYTIPGKEEWTLIMNTTTDAWGADGYDEKNDVLRMKVKPNPCEHVESMEFSINNLKMNSAVVTLRWGKLSIGFAVEVEVEKLALANLEAEIEKAKNAWKTYRNAANYTALSGTHLDKGLEWINTSIELNGDSWNSYWIKAHVLLARKDVKGAIGAAEKAITMGEAHNKDKDGVFEYKDMLQEEIAKWQKL